MKISFEDSVVTSYSLDRKRNVNFMSKQEFVFSEL